MKPSTGMLFTLLFPCLAAAAVEAAPLPFDEAERFGQSQPRAPAQKSPGPAEAKALKAQGDQLLRENKPLEAAQAFDKAVEADPMYADARGSLATLLLDLGRSDLAYQQYAELTRQRPKDANAFYGMGMAAYREGRLGEGIERLGEALRLDPDLAAARRDLGHILLSNGRTMEASSLYGEAVRLRPQDADAHNDYGVVLTRVGDLANAAASFRKAVELNPKHVDAQYNLGLTLLRRRHRSRR
jgi:Flp pilus assembly protein TadD